MCVKCTDLHSGCEEEAAHLNERLDGLHNLGLDLLGLRDSELVVEAEEVVLVAGPYQEEGRVLGGQQGKALDKISCTKHNTHSRWRKCVTCHVHVLIVQQRSSLTWDGAYCWVG